MSTSTNSESIFSGKKILITGHTGFKGSWLTKWLLKKGASVYGISNEIPTVPSLFETLELENQIEHLIMDVRDTEDMVKTIHRIAPDFVFHLAAQPIVSISYRDPVATLTTNAIGTANILEGIRGLSNKCIGIMITSDKCYENVEWEYGYKETDMLGGKDIYSGSKAAAEIVYHSYFHSFLKKMGNIRTATVRAGNVIGGGDWAEDRIIPDCIRSWSENQKVFIRSPYATRPWQHVLEPLSGYLAIAANLWESDKLNGESFNFGPVSDNNITVLDLISRISKRWKFDHPESSYDIQQNAAFSEAGLLKLNCDKALFHLRWVPTLNLEELIEFTGDWYYQFYFNKKDIKEFTDQQLLSYEQKAISKDLNWTKK